MGYKTKIDKRTGKTLYAWRYYFLNEEGKKVDTNTGYFETKGEAEAEGRRLEQARKEEREHTELKRRDKYLVTAFQEFINELEKKAHRKTTDNTSSDDAMYHRAITIRDKYMPEGIKKTKVRSIEPIVFRDWVSYINQQDISGNYVRNLRSTLALFNKWLRDNGYYFTNRNLDIEIGYAMSNTTIKSKKVKNRELNGERNLLSIADIDNICNFFYKRGIGKFENFYFYTLYYVLFYSGMRIEELVGLQWKNVDLDKYGVIKITNSINEREKRENVMERLKQGIYRTKNNTSERVLPILENYRELLVDYRTSYKYEYKVKEEEMGECFVFPMLSKHNPRVYLYSGYITRRLKEPLNELGLKNTDCQMFRHSCATFLIMPYPEGLGFDEQKVIDYFGHTDTEMLKTVYARLNTLQKSERLKQTFSEYYKMEKTEEAKEEEKKQKERIETIKGNTDIAKKARKGRMFAEIENAIAKKQKAYYYNKKDKWVIDEYLKDNKKPVIEFVVDK